MNPLAAFDPWRAQHRRTAWLPELGPGPSLSHFGGAPWLPDGERWPVCAACGQPQQLFLQLELEALPEEHGTGLLQIFYCTRTEGCDVDNQGWAAFSPCHLLRVLQISGPGAEAHPLPDSFPCRFIASWRPLDDLPDPESHENLGIVYTYDWAAKTVDISCPALGVSASGPYDGPVCAEALAQALEGDKLGGWPQWVQREEIPFCPQCERPMEYLLQLGSEDHVPYLWGDVGTATVTRCRAHPQVLALGWACS